MCEPKENILEAYKMVIDYNKIVISLSSTILAGLIGLLVLQETKLTWTNYLSPFFLVLSIILALIGFGQSIRTVKTEISNKKAILYTNLSVFSLIFGILLIAFVKIKQEHSIDNILEEISKTTSTLEKELNPKNCTEIFFSNDKYTFYYGDIQGKAKVTYSTKRDRIISIE